MAGARRAWLLIWAPSIAAGCVQILGIQPWVPADAGAGAGGAGGAPSATTSSSTSGSDGDVDACSSTAPSCQACEGCADLTGGACATDYAACAGATDAGGCNHVLECIATCGGDSTCIGVCPGQEIAAMPLFPAYAACLCAQCAPSCASFAAVFCDDAGGSTGPSG